MKKPALQDDAFLADLSSVRYSPQGNHEATLWWLGQSGFLIHHRGRFILLDPYLSDSLTRKYAATDKPHVRMTERVVDPARLDFIDVVTASHAHTDHLDPETLQPLARANPRLVLVCPESARTTARERSGLPDHRIIGLDAPDPASAPPKPSELPAVVSDITFTPIPAAHENLDRDSQGRLLHLGLVVDLGPLRIYHSGDTVRFEGMSDLLRPFAVNVALLPINGRAPERRVAGNLGGREAAGLARDIEAGVVIPCHYDMFEFNTAAPEEFVIECQKLGQPFQVLEQGARLRLSLTR